MTEYFIELSSSIYYKNRFRSLVESMLEPERSIYFRVRQRPGQVEQFI